MTGVGEQTFDPIRKQCDVTHQQRPDDKDRSEGRADDDWRKDGATK